MLLLFSCHHRSIFSVCVCERDREKERKTESSSSQAKQNDTGRTETTGCISARIGTLSHSRIVLHTIKSEFSVPFYSSLLHFANAF